LSVRRNCQPRRSSIDVFVPLLSDTGIPLDVFSSPAPSHSHHGRQHRCIPGRKRHTDTRRTHPGRCEARRQARRQARGDSRTHSRRRRESNSRRRRPTFRYSWPSRRWARAGTGPQSRPGASAQHQEQPVGVRLAGVRPHAGKQAEQAHGVRRRGCTGRHGCGRARPLDGHG